MTVLLVFAALAGSALAAAAPQIPGASEVKPPTRFERILWTGDPAAIVSRLAELGFTAVPLAGGADPEPITEHGLGYYLDQPIGKGVLELRDRDFVPLRQAYEKSRDPSVLIRPGCLAVPGRIDELAEKAAAEARRVAGPGLRFVALADEPSATRHDAPLDTCWCERCLAGFRRFARARFESIGDYNEANGTQFENFDDALPLSTDQVRRRELGDSYLPRDLRAWALRLDFVDRQFADASRRIGARVASAVPGVPVGFTGTSAPAAFGGCDPRRLLPHQTLAEPYPVGGARALAASFLPRTAHRYATLFPPREGGPSAAVPVSSWVRSRLCDLAMHGEAGVIVWNDASVFGEGYELRPFGRAVRDGLREWGAVLDACAGAEVAARTIWIVESQASVRLWWMLDSAGDGMTWTRRLASYEATHSTSQAARRSWLLLLRDLGFQPRFVAARDLPRLLPAGRPHCLVLPATIAMSDRAAQAIESYARVGGTVLADHSPGLYRDDLWLREVPALDGVFGVVERSLRWQDLQVREGRLVAGDDRRLLRAERGLRAGRSEVAERHRDGDSFVERRVGRGRAVYLNAAVCEYARLRLDPDRAGLARELRRRVRAVLRRSRCIEPCDVRGEGLPTLIERAVLRLRDGRHVLAVRIAADDDPRILSTLAASGPKAIRLELPKPRTLRHLGGQELGTGRVFELELDPFGALFLEILER